MSNPYRIPPGWTDDAARLVWEDYSARVECDRSPLIGVEDAVDLEDAADIFHEHDDPDAVAAAAITCLAERGLVVVDDEYAGWRGKNCRETVANRLRAWAAVGAPIVAPTTAGR